MVSIDAVSSFSSAVSKFFLAVFLSRFNLFFLSSSAHQALCAASAAASSLSFAIMLLIMSTTLAKGFALTRLAASARVLDDRVFADLRSNATARSLATVRFEELDNCSKVAG